MMNADAVFGVFPELSSEASGLLLKKIEPNHWEELHEIFSNEKVFRYCGILPKKSKDAVRNMIGHFERDYNKRSKVKWGIFSKDEEEQLLGIVEAFDFDARVNKATIGYFLTEKHWGKGVATEAVKLLTDYLFGMAQVNRIQAEVMPANEASKKVLLKNGFRLEGMIRQGALWTGQGIVDLEIYGLLKEDMR